MTDSHWDDTYKEVSRRSEREEYTAPDLEDNSLDELARKITQGAMNNPEGISELLSSEEAAAKINSGPDGETSEQRKERWQEESDRRERGEAERERRRDQFAADKAEADGLDISVGELRQRRFDEQNKEPEPLVAEEKPEAEPGEEAAPAADKVVELLATLVTEAALIREKLNELTDRKNGVHG